MEGEQSLASMVTSLVLAEAPGRDLVVDHVEGHELGEARRGYGQVGVLREEDRFRWLASMTTADRAPMEGSGREGKAVDDSVPWSMLKSLDWHRA